MGKGGTTGPFRGAYCQTTFATAGLAAGAGATGATAFPIGAWIIPAGMDIVLVNAQGFLGGGGTVRTNLLAGSTSVLSTANQSTGVTLATGSATAMALDSSVLGTSPPSTRPNSYGVYIVGGTTLTATASNTAGSACHNVTQLITWYPVTHPTVIP